MERLAIKLTATRMIAIKTTVMKTTAMKMTLMTSQHAAVENICHQKHKMGTKIMVGITGTKMKTRRMIAMKMTPTTSYRIKQRHETIAIKGDNRK